MLMILIERSFLSLQSTLISSRDNYSYQHTAVTCFRRDRFTDHDPIFLLFYVFQVDNFITNIGIDSILIALLLSQCFRNHNLDVYLTIQQ